MNRKRINALLIAFGKTWREGSSEFEKDDLVINCSPTKIVVHIVASFEWGKKKNRLETVLVGRMVEKS